MKKVLKVFRLLFNSMIHPTHFSIIFRDLFNRLYTTRSDKEHLDAAIAWLCKSQDVSKKGGCAGVYTFETGWTPPYPETTGYIIPTFLEYSELTNDPIYIERAKKIGDWELDIQLPSGAVRGGVGINEYPIVFNTGQVMIGWVALYKKTQSEKYLKASIKAAEWLVKIQDEDGKWGQHTYNNIPHSYNVRVTWALLDVAVLTKNAIFKEAAEKNIRWVLSKANMNAWFEHMGFTINEQPLTHTIAYTLRGLLECSFLVGDSLKNEIINKVNRASEIIMDKYESISTKGPNLTRGFLPGTFNSNWDLNEKYSCLTGNAQMSIIWMKLYKINGNENFLKTAIKNIEQLKSTQNLKSRNSGIRGGIAGSYPIWGKYTNFAYPNWAAKFFADALMLKNTISKD